MQYASNNCCLTCRTEFIKITNYIRLLPCPTKDPRLYATRPTFRRKRKLFCILSIERILILQMLDLACGCSYSLIKTRARNWQTDERRCRIMQPTVDRVSTVKCIHWFMSARNSINGGVLIDEESQGTYRRDSVYHLEYAFV